MPLICILKNNENCKFYVIYILLNPQKWGVEVTDKAKYRRPRTRMYKVGNAGEGNSSQMGANYPFIPITAHCSKGQEKVTGLNLRCSTQKNCRGNSVKSN